MYEQLEKMDDSKFNRKTGFEKAVFARMTDVVIEMEKNRKKLSGRPPKISYENQVLMTLERLKDNSTYFNLSQIYGISEANCYKICKKIERFLENSGQLKLTKQKTGD